MTGSKTRINDNRVLEVNGQPFFPLGARHMPVGGTPALLQEAGFNCMRWVAFGTETSDVAPMQLPDDLGSLFFYPYLFDRADFGRDLDRRRAALEQLVRAVGEHPGLLCYEQRNEPTLTQRKTSSPCSPPGMAEGSAFLRSIDPQHPIRIGHACGTLKRTLQQFNPAVDMLGCNPYVVIHPEMRRHVGTRFDGKIVDCPNQTLSAVGDYTRKMFQVGGERAVWMMLQATASENWYSEEHHPEYRGQGMYPHHVLYPSWWQMRFMAFQAIIAGATALEWAMHRLCVDEPAWQDVTRVMTELQQLQPVLAAPTYSGSLPVAYEELGFSDWSGVEIRAKVDADSLWLLAANTQFDPMEAVITLPSDYPSKQAIVHNENRTVAISNGKLQDRFQPYEVHVYQLS